MNTTSTYQVFFLPICFYSKSLAEAIRNTLLCLHIHTGKAAVALIGMSEALDMIFCCGIEKTPILFAN